jgi:uncharacterized glyoxalase superfamily protein PhnB
MSDYPKFQTAFNIGNNNEERTNAFEMYQKAFNAKKISETIPPDGWEIHIAMEINGYEFLLLPGEKDAAGGRVYCQFQYNSEDELRQTYDVLSREAINSSITTDFWSPLFAIVTDKYGINWCLYMISK